MAILPIICYDDEILRRICDPVDNPGEFRRLAGDMAETMLAAKGIGLAAPQVGRSVRLIMIHHRMIFTNEIAMRGPDDEEFGPFPLFNPEYEPLGVLFTDREGCLSLPEIYGRAARYDKVRLRALDIEGEKIELELDGMAARVVQHEVDHLEGVLFVDRLNKAQRMLLNRRLKALDAQTKRGWRRIVPDEVAG